MLCSEFLNLIFLKFSTDFPYFSNAFNQRAAVSILRLPNGLDFSNFTPAFLPTPSIHPNGVNTHESVVNMNSLGSSMDEISIKRPKFMHCDSNLNLEAMSNSNTHSYTLPQPRECITIVIPEILFLIIYSHSSDSKFEKTPAADG